MLFKRLMMRIMKMKKMQRVNTNMNMRRNTAMKNLKDFIEAKIINLEHLEV